MSFSEGGLGWKVWGTALMLADQLAAAPALVEGRRVLEIGSGCGLCGLLAAKLGACSVTLTDCVPSVLSNLEENVVHLPAQPVAVLEDLAAGSKQQGDFCHHWSRAMSNEDELEEGECFVSVRYLEWAEDSGLASCEVRAFTS